MWLAAVDIATRFLLARVLNLDCGELYSLHERLIVLETSILDAHDVLNMPLCIGSLNLLLYRHLLELLLLVLKGLDALLEIFLGTQLIIHILLLLLCELIVMGNGTRAQVGLYALLVCLHIILDLGGLTMFDGGQVG